MFKNSSKTLWAAFHIILFAIVPISVLIIGFEYIKEQKEKSLLETAEFKVETEYKTLEFYLNDESFFHDYFNNIFTKTIKSNDPKKLLEQANDLLYDSFEYILWNTNNRVLASSIDPNDFEGDWSFFWNETFHKCVNLKPEKRVYTAEETLNYRKLFGPQIVLDHVYINGNRYSSILRCDTRNERPYVWLNSTKNMSHKIAIFIEPENLEKHYALKHYLEHVQPQNQDIVFNAVINGRAVLKNVAEYSESKGIFKVFQDDELLVYASVKEEFFSQEKFADNYLYIAIPIFFLFPWIYLSIKKKITQKPLFFNISKKLLLLFLYANGLPLAMLFFIGYEYIIQKELSLYDNIHAKGTQYILNFDDRLESEYAMQINNIRKALNNFFPTLKKGLKKENYIKFLEDLNIKDHDSSGVYFIASSSKDVGTSRFLKINNEEIILNEYEPGRKKDLAEEFDILASVLRFILGIINGTPQDTKTTTELEILSESFLQKPLIEIEHQFIAADGEIFSFGVGDRNISIFNTLISVFDNNKFDYTVAMNWTNYYLESMYIERQILHANRNIEGLKFYVVHSNKNVLPSKTPDKETLKKATATLDEKPNTPRHFVTYNNSKYLLMGLKSRKMENRHLIALYPVSKILDEIENEKKYLFLASIISLLLTIILGRILSETLEYPIKQLTEGAKALTRRDFKKRLPKLGNNEFAEIAEVFNDTMVDFEELQVAGAIKEHLLPSTVPNTLLYSVYAEIHSQSELNGKYYDYFESSKDNVSLIVGSADENGTAAALIMAMVKAAIINEKKLLESPAKIGERIDYLLKQIKKSARVNMSLQYISIDISERKGKCLNAGKALPILVNGKARRVMTIGSQGNKLGESEISNYKETNFEFKDNSAIIMCTNPNYTKLLVEKAADAYHKDPATYTNNLIKSMNIKESCECSILVFTI